MDRIKFKEEAQCSLVRSGLSGDIMNPHGVFYVWHYRDGQLLDYSVNPNTIANEGRDHILDVQFHGGTQITSWNLGLVDDDGFSAITVNDTYDDIDQAGNGWDEFTAYTDANNSDSAVTRPEWPEDAASSQSIANSSFALFDITGSGTVKGLFLAGGPNADTKGDHTASGNVLWCATLFSGGDRAVANLDQLRVVYALSW